MPAKIRSPRAPKKLSLQDRIVAHVEASEQCRKWALKAKEHHEAGEDAAAASAYAKARRCMEKMLELEKLCKPT